MIWLGSFSPTLRVVSFMISVHEGTAKLLPVFYFVFLLFCICRSISFHFHCVTLHSHRISMSDAIRNSFPSLQTKQVGIRLNPFHDSCILFHSLFWSMRGRHFSRPIDPCLTFRSFPFPCCCSANPNDISILDAIRIFACRFSR